MAKLKLYVWEGVLTDYTDGVMFAYAANKKEARELLSERVGDHADLKIEPRRIRSKEGFVLYGGG